MTRKKNCDQLKQEHVASEFRSSAANSALLGDPCICLHTSNCFNDEHTEEPARKMLTSTATGGYRGGFDYAGEYFEACRSFLAGTETSSTSKLLVHVKDATMDRLLKVNGEKRFIGYILLSKAKRDRSFKT